MVPIEGTTNEVLGFVGSDQGPPLTPQRPKDVGSEGFGDV